MGSWVRTITSPFRKACTLFSPSRDKKSQAGYDHHGLKLHGEVMACSYEDVRVMWSILDKSRPRNHSSSSSDGYDGRPEEYVEEHVPYPGKQMQLKLHAQGIGM